MQNSCADRYSCHLCAKNAVEMLPHFSEFSRVTSDYKLWGKGGTLGVCQNCRQAQRIVTEAWYEEIKQIYLTYEINPQSHGMEQMVFNQTEQFRQPRSMQIIKQVKKMMNLPNSGSLLDVGCGNGAFLNAFSF